MGRIRLDMGICSGILDPPDKEGWLSSTALCLGFTLYQRTVVESYRGEH